MKTVENRIKNVFKKVTDHKNTNNAPRVLLFTTKRICLILLNLFMKFIHDK